MLLQRNDAVEVVFDDISENELLPLVPGIGEVVSIARPAIHERNHESKGLTYVARYTHQTLPQTGRFAYMIFIQLERVDHKAAKYLSMYD